MSSQEERETQEEATWPEAETRVTRPQAEMSEPPPMEEAGGASGGSTAPGHLDLRPLSPDRERATVYCLSLWLQEMLRLAQCLAPATEEVLVLLLLSEASDSETG